MYTNIHKSIGAYNKLKSMVPSPDSGQAKLFNNFFLLRPNYLTYNKLLIQKKNYFTFKKCDLIDKSNYHIFYFLFNKRALMTLALGCINCCAHTCRQKDCLSTLFLWAKWFNCFKDSQKLCWIFILIVSRSVQTNPCACDFKILTYQNTKEVKFSRKDIFFYQHSLAKQLIS